MNKKEKYHRFTEPVIVILQLKFKERYQKTDTKIHPDEVTYPLFKENRVDHL